MSDYGQAPALKADDSASRIQRASAYQHMHSFQLDETDLTNALSTNTKNVYLEVIRDRRTRCMVPPIIHRVASIT